MGPGEFFLVIFIEGIILLLSRVLDSTWAQTIPFRVLYYIIRAPGVIIHECCHVFGCLITGAKIKNVVLFSKTGGSVSYLRPAIPYLGDVIISMAPVIGVPVILVGITWVFQTYSGCYFPPFPLYIHSINSLNELLVDLMGLFSQNLMVNFNIWFVLYLYLTLSLATSIAPSGQDIKNCIVGIAIIFCVGILVLWSNIPWAVNALSIATRIIGMGIVLGFVFVLIAFIVSIPFIIIHIIKRATKHRP